MRRVLDDKDIDAVVIATPNHWHALATDLGAAGGQARLRREALVAHRWEGRKMVEATNRYSKIVQVGTMNRSRPAVRAGDQVHARRRHRQGVHGSRSLLQAARVDRQVPRRTDGAGREVNRSRSTPRRQFEPAYDAAISVEGRLRPVARPRAEAAVQPQPLPLQLALALGVRQRRHRQPGTASVRHRALGADKQEHPVKISSTGGYFGPESSQETPDTQTALFEYPDGTILEFATRGEYHQRRRTAADRQPLLRLEGLALDRRDGRKWQSYFGRARTRRGRAPTPPRTGGDPSALEARSSPHYQNFVDAIRADNPKLLTCDVLEGHLSSALPHLANISYRVGRSLEFDGKSETFVDDKKADRLLTRPYRKGFEVPKSV